MRSCFGYAAKSAKVSISHNCIAHVSHPDIAETWTFTVLDRSHWANADDRLMLVPCLLAVLILDD